MDTRRQMQKFLAACLAAALLWTAPLPASAAEAGPAEEETAAAEAPWYAAGAAYCEENGLIGGTPETRFDPYAPITRAQIANIFYRAAGAPKLEGFPIYPFEDVRGRFWYTNGIIWAWRRGVMTGYNELAFGPDDPVTREQFSVILWNYAGSPEPDAGAGPVQPFPDAAEIADWAQDAVEWLSSAGMVSGREDGAFDPEGTCSQAEAVVMLARYFSWLGGAPDDPDLWREPEPEDELWPGSAPGYIPPNTYDPAGFVKRGGFLTYQAPGVPSYVGIDVSSYQKQVDWEKVAAAGVDFAIIRAGYRGYTAGSLNQDRYFRANMEGALAAGLDVGVYFFSQAVTEEEARAEAEQTLRWLRGYDITYPVVFDWEEIDKPEARSYGVGGETIVACARAFCQTVQEAGYLPMTYGSPTKVYNDLDLSRLQDWPFWLANYTKDWNPTKFRYHYHMWQYSSTGSVPGIQGNVDLDLCLTDFSKFKK